MDKTILKSGSLAYDRIMNFGGRFKDHILSDLGGFTDYINFGKVEI